MIREEEDVDGLDPSDEELVSHRLSFGARLPKKLKKKEAPKRNIVKSAQTLNVNGKTAEFLDKAIVIHLKSLCRDL